MKEEEIKKALRELVEVVEGYVCPKKGDKYVSRSEVLGECDKVKKLLEK